MTSGKTTCGEADDGRRIVQAEFLFLIIIMRERPGKGMGGADEGCEWRTTLGKVCGRLRVTISRSSDCAFFVADLSHLNA